MKIPLMKLLELIIFKSKKVATSWMGKVGGKTAFNLYCQIATQRQLQPPFQIVLDIMKTPTPGGTSHIIYSNMLN